MRKEPCNFASQLYAIMRSKKISVQQIARATGIPAIEIALWLDGQKDPNITQQKRVAQFVDMKGVQLKNHSNRYWLPWS